ncbi:MAG: hypothetical protein RH862_15590 [Leptospiraceae bacterium]
MKSAFESKRSPFKESPYNPVNRRKTDRTIQLREWKERRKHKLGDRRMNPQKERTRCTEPRTAQRLPCSGGIDPFLNELH